MIKTELTKDNKRVYEELFEKNDPQIRADVLTALKAKHGISQPDLFWLELSLQYGDRSFYDAEDTLSPEVIDKLKNAIETSVAELNEEPESARSIVVGNILQTILNSWKPRAYYNLPRLSEWQASNQPTPETFTDLLEQGEDPRLIALMMINIYGSRKDFAELSSVVGNNILNWENGRSLDYKERQAHKPENKNLSDDMQLVPAGLVAIEPYVDMERDFHYDIYGSIIAEMTSFSVKFIPKKGVGSRDLQQHVEKAVNRLVEEGEVTFQGPTSSYKNPHNAYKRPTGIDTGITGEYIDYWGNFLDFWKIKNPSIVREHWGIFYCSDEETNEVFDSDEISGSQINKWLLSDDFPKNLPQKLIDDIKNAAGTVKHFRHTTISDEGHVILNNTLILDDVLQLYEFCDEFLSPSVKIAQTLEAARYAEECGPLKSPGGLGDDYSRDHLRLTDQLGNFDNVDPEQIVDKALHDIMAFYGRGGNAQMAFLQAASLAHGTLMGVLPDGTGQFPTLAQITDETIPDQNMALTAIAEDNIAERTNQLLKRAVSLFGEPDSDLPLKAQFKDASLAMSELLRYQQKIDDICNHYIRDLRNREHRKRGNMLDSIHDEPQSPADLLSEERGYALHCFTSHKRYEPQREPIDIINALAGRIGHDRLWVKTDVDRNMKRKKNKEPNPANQFTKDTIMPDNLDVLSDYIWRCCKESMFKKAPTLKDNPDFLPTMRANIDTHSGLTPPQLPRDFDGTFYVTRPAGSPFPRPNTDLPQELADLLPKRSKDREERAQLPDPSVIWGEAYKPSP